MSVDASAGPRHAPPALLVAVAAGLASLDMPIPNVASWDWANWKFPRPIRAGDTIYARWTLTQKRAAVRGAETSIAVWRVDVHTADGVLCAEGEVGASVFRGTSAPSATMAAPTQESAPVAPAPASRRRRRKRSSSEPAAAAPAPPPPPPAAAQPQERAGSGRRRRRRRSSGGGSANDNHVLPAPAAVPLPAPEPARSAAPAASRETANPLSRALKRLRRTP